MDLPKAWVCYAAWNEAIRAQLFDGSHAGQPVYLDIDGPYLETAFARVSTVSPGPTQAREHLIASLRGTLDEKEPFKRHRSQAGYWRQDFFSKHLVQEVPPFLALLAVLAVVAEEMAAEGAVAANDYFGRLTQRINGAVGSSFSKDAVQRSYYRHVDGLACQKAGDQSLWTLLNEWLEALDGEVGLPTAYAVDGREYVSVPVSQALIRTADRADLHRLFSRTFEEYRDPTGEEMMAVLDRVLQCPPFSRPLVNMWKRPANRPRIAELARAELASWDSTWEEEDAGHGTSRVSARALIRARLVGGPRRALHLSLTLRGSDRVRGIFKLPSDCPPLARRCIVEGHDQVRVELSSVGSGLTDISPASAVDLREVLVRRLELVADGKRITRPYRAVNLFEFDREEQVFLETDRASAGQPLLVLASDGLADRTRELLGWIARPGFQEIAAGLRGLPAGWVLFRDVEILGQVPDDVEVLPDLEPLLPALRLEIALAGGFYLPGGSRRSPEWHLDRPPELVVSHPDPSCRVEMTARQLPDDPVAVPFGSVEGMGSIDLPVASLDTAYPVEVVSEGAGLVAVRRMQVRSADRPRAVPPEMPVSLIVDSEGMLVGAARMQSATGLITVGSGADLDNSFNGGAAGGNDGLPPSVPGWLRARPRDVDVDANPSDDDIVRAAEPVADLPACVLRPGAHHWVLPTSTAETVVGSCKHCGRAQRFRNRYQRESTQTTAPAPDPARTERVVTAVTSAVRRTAPVPPADDGDDWDLLLDAISAVGAGSWANFAALTSQAVPSQPPKEVARVLAGLGHVELEQSPGIEPPTRWSCSLTTVVVPDDSPPFLAGFRSRTIVQRLTDMVAAEDGEVRATRAADQPALVQLLGLDADLLAVVAEKGSANGHEMRLARSPATQLVSRLPNIDVLRGRLPVISFLTRYEESFDLASAQWGPHDGLLSAGAAVRAVEQPVSYGFVETVEQGGRVSLRRGDVRLVKHLAAAAQSRPLVAYNENEQTLAVPLGAELPWLFDRVAVLCSGIRPQRDRGLVTYLGIPSAIAAGIWSRVT